MKKVAVVVASRANYARVKTVLRALQDSPDVELQLIVGASALLHRYGNAVSVIENDGFEPVAKVQFLIEGETPATMAKSTGLAMIELSSIFERLAPDCVVTVADRYETLATAVSASYMNIPVAHTQGGEVTGSIDESVRHAITKLSHLHFPATEVARQRLLSMGEHPEWVFHSGCPAIDLILETDLTQCPQAVLSRYGGTGEKLDLSKPYLLVMQHPVTTEFTQALQQIQETIKALEKLRMQTIMLWPNADAGSDDVAKGMRLYREQLKPEYVHFYRNFTPEDFLVLMHNAACMIGNSSSAIREGAFLGMPAVNVGNRQNARERGRNVLDAHYDAAEIVTAVRRHLAIGRYPSDHLYGDGHAGERIAQILTVTERAAVPIQKTLYTPQLSEPMRYRRTA
ncbi:MAG: UDP-N-acetylglucosamine 2-epimerase (hydrolyzing) [Pirellulales bacterium]|jgi:UDP-hydrolysing UDP-N-acetyl-D-glucosamine 2-epimerase|nr:UDP-N-acetylglucosamine 2-epimerase (hydrolyzing) [Pirellulales bacterium]